jgi:hypothetical protein
VYGVAYWLAAFVWGAVIYRLPLLRRGPYDRARRAHWLTLFALALALTVRLEPVYRAVNHLTGVSNVAQLIEHSLILTASWSVQEFLVALNYPDRHTRPPIRLHGWMLAASVAAMSVLFALAPLDEETLEFWDRYANAPFVFEYRLVYLACLGSGLTNIVRLAWRYAGQSNRPNVSVGLRLVAVGSIFGLGYVAHEGLYIVARQTGIEYPLRAVVDPSLVREALIAVTISLSVIGGTLPAWGHRAGIATLCRWLDRYRTYRRLYPLWRAVVQATPEIALMPPQSPLADFLTVRGLDLRLYRRVVEIWDGQLALRPYSFPEIADTARTLCQAKGVPAEEVPAIVQAATVAAALQAKRQGSKREHAGPAYQPIGNNDGSGEVAFLLRVAHYYQHSSLVPAVLAQLGLNQTRTAPRSVDHVTNS